MITKTVWEFDHLSILEVVAEFEGEKRWQVRTIGSVPVGETPSVPLYFVVFEREVL